MLLLAGPCDPPAEQSSSAARDEMFTVWMKKCRKGLTSHRSGHLDPLLQVPYPDPLLACRNQKTFIRAEVHLPNSRCLLGSRISLDCFGLGFAQETHCATSRHFIQVTG